MRKTRQQEVIIIESECSVMHDEHRIRMKKRFLKEGLDSFDKHNILELLLYYGIPRKNTNETAHNLMNTFGSLSGVLDAPYEELLKVKGIGENSACLLKLIPAVCRSYLDDKFEDGDTINSTESAGEFLQKKYIALTNEVFSMICMDNKGRVINWAVVTEGSVNATEVNIRKVIEIALRNSATSVIIAHNHPNGLALPSKQDIVTTEKLVKALHVIGVFLVDHIIIGGNDYVSMADSKSLSYIFDAADE